MKLSVGLFIALVFGAFACKKDVPPARPSSGSVATGKRLLICNEGNFGLGNSTVTMYDPLTGNTVHDVYGSVNNNQSPGDVLQSVGYFNDKYYWIVNNSGKVVLTDRNFVHITTVGGFISPRYITFVSNNKAYITNLQLNSAVPNYIQVLDLASNTILKTIRLDGWTEQLVESYGKVFVANQRKNYVYVIDAATDVITDSIFMNASSAYLVKDKNEKIWVTCNANATNNLPARLVRLNPLNDSVETAISLGTTQNSVSRLTINGAGDMLYYLLNDVYRLPVSSVTPASPFIQQGNRVFYGLVVDPDDESIYVSDAIDFNQDGTILRYHPDGTLHSSFKAGIIPGTLRME